jgi:hypothetical protein
MLWVFTHLFLEKRGRRGRRMILYTPKYLQKITEENPIVERALHNIMRQAHCAAREGYNGVSDKWDNSVHKINSKSQREFIKSVLVTMGYADVKIKKYSFTISWRE